MINEATRATHRLGSSGSSRWHTWGTLAVVAGLSVLQAACGGGQDGASDAASPSGVTSSRARALAITPTTPLLLEDTVYALRSLGSPELVLAEQGVGSTLGQAAVPATATVEETSRFLLIQDPQDLGCVVLQAKRLTGGPNPGTGVPHQLRLDAVTRSLVWERIPYSFYVPAFPAAVFCPETTADGRGMVMRLQADRTQVLRVASGQVGLATETATSAFGDSAVFQAVALERLAGTEPPSLSYAPEMFKGGQVTAGTSLELRLEAGSADGIESVTIQDDTTQGFAPPQVVSVLTSAPYVLNWTPAIGRHRVSFVVRTKAGGGLQSGGNDLRVLGPNVPPTVRLCCSWAVSAGHHTPFLTASDPDGTLARIEMLEGGEVLSRLDLNANYSTASPELWLTPGRHTLTARVTDDSGAVTLSAPVTVDAVARSAPVPVATWLSPASVSEIRADAALRLRANARATVADGLFSVSFVAVRDGERAEVRLDNVSVGSVTSVLNTDVEIEVAPNTLKPGTYSVYAVPLVIGPEGNEVRSAPLRLTVRDPAGTGPFVVTATDQAALDTPVALSTAGPDTRFAGAVARIDFYDGHTLVGSDSTSPYTFDWRSSVVGLHALQARAVHSNGTVTLSDLRSVQIKRPGNRPPTVAITAPAAGTLVNPDTAFQVTTNPGDADGHIVSASLYDGSKLLSTRTGAPWTFDVALPAGDHTLTVKATDNDQEVGTSAPVTVTSRNQLPTIDLQVPSSGTAGQLQVLASTPGDRDGWITRVDFYDGTRLIGVRISYPWAISWQGAAGVHTITARATDISGGVTTSAARTLTLKSASNLPPRTGLAGVANGAILLPGTAVTLSTNPGDTDGWITRVDFYDGATLIGSRTSRPWTMNWVAATTGPHVLSARATDNEGAVSAPAAITASVKSGGNTPPKARITAPATGTSVAVGTPVTLTSNPGDTDGWITRLEFYDGATLIGTRTVKPWAIDWSGAVGAHALSVKVFDNEGASSTSAPVSVTVTP